MTGVCELCASRHERYQAHSFDSSVNSLRGCRERDALIAELRAKTKVSKPGAARKDYMREYMRSRRQKA